MEASWREWQILHATLRPSYSYFSLLIRAILSERVNTVRGPLYCNVTLVLMLGLSANFPNLTGQQGNGLHICPVIGALL